MEKKLQKIYLIDYNLLIAQDLWQGHYQILLIIFLKKFIDLNVNMDMTIKNVKIMELLGYTNFKDDLIIYVATKTINKSLLKI